MQRELNTALTTQETGDQVPESSIEDRTQTPGLAGWLAARIHGVRDRDATWHSKVATVIALIGLPFVVIGALATVYSSVNSPNSVGVAVPSGVASGMAPTPYLPLDGARDKECRILLPKPSPAGPNFEVCMLVKGADGEQKRDTATYPFGLMRVLVEYRNTGASQQNNVVFRVTLPSGFSLVPGTTVSINSNTPEGLRVSDHVSKEGVNLGSYASGAAAYLIFHVQAGDPKKFDCGEDRGVLIFRIDTDNGTKAANSMLSVVRKCAS